MATPQPDRVPPEREGGGFLTRLKRVFRVGPFSWMLRALPPSRRFRPGERMHGLERQDVPEQEPDALGGTGVQDVPTRRSGEPPAT